jgi:hypothetical protein
MIYSTSTPTVCSVTSAGLVRALTLGTCRTSTYKTGDAAYVNTATASRSISIASATGTSALKLLKTIGTGTTKRVSVNLGKGYANRSVLLQVRPAGGSKFSTLATVKLNSVGHYESNRALAKNSTLQVVLASKTLAVIKVTGK